MNERFKALKSKLSGALGKRSLRLGANPTVDWILVLAIFLVLTLFSVSFTYLHYSAVRMSFMDAESSGANGINLLPRGLLDSVLIHYEGRKAGISEIIESPVPVIDPSL